ncbi:flavin-containing amine oxidoreductase-domain containing protein [Lineolata rhizophorae]|uniref:Flavin-containing amine oxidoreductase-domain containing protein n=1 Tax=Lineolata rhizophorae TaxID=578093 RepID=A0A6A6P7F8_9PEZI|nr:flavin-containing amine oxidoreductase-domain containing protein [Lineolata rhizophorae]
MLALRSALSSSLAFWSLFVPSLGNAVSSDSVSFIRPAAVESGGAQNIEIEYHRPIDGELSIHYGACDLDDPAFSHHRIGTAYIGNHELAKRHVGWDENRPSRFVWVAPESLLEHGCLHAFSGIELVGRSDPIPVMKRNNQRRAVFAEIADSEGPWFDGVEYLSEKEPDDVFVAQAKSSTVGIIGGGMSGLMTAYLLDSVGIHDYTIIESSYRIGGRVHTTYLNGTSPDDYQYQEMGPMRFPVSITDPDTNETIQIMDHRMVFQLAETLNEMNGNDPDYAVNFIPWIQNSPNTPTSTSKRRPDGTVPGTAEVEESPAYQDNPNATYSNATAVAEAEEAYEEWVGLDEDDVRAIAANIFQAHKDAVDRGLLDFSEAEYLRRVLRLDLNITDQVDTIDDHFPSWEYDSVYFAATEWRTIDKGLSQLPAAFGPLVLNRTMFGTNVHEMEWDEESEQMTIKWRSDNPFDMNTDSKTFDYTVVAVPFSKVRIWRLPDYTSLLSRAINTLNYQQACKVALHYKTRFWEHLEHPIFGGCGSTDIPGIGSICYPSYKLNSSLPGALLANYRSGVLARSLGALDEVEHVALVQRAMAEIHGEIANEQFTGAYDRICWEFDRHQAGAWCSPLSGQQELYLPAYFHTEKHTVFVGEHTSYTHAWIFSALESGVRGTTQLLLEMGLVDEAKAVVDQWMARWISV